MILARRKLFSTSSFGILMMRRQYRSTSLLVAE
jgi:hypothetical protein